MERGLSIAEARVPPPLTPSWRTEARAVSLLTAPIAAGFLAEMAMSFTDTIIVGRTIGAHAIGAVGIAAHVLFSLLVVCMGVVSVVGALGAQSHGAGDPLGVARVVRQGFWVATVLSLPATLAGWYLAPLLRWLGQEEQVVEIADDYLKGLVWCFLPYMWFTVLRNFVTALGRTVCVMVIAVTAIFVNLVLVYGLVTGSLGLPALGVRGAGYGTSLVSWGMFIALAIHVMRAPGLRDYHIFGHLLDFEPAIFGRILRLGLPAGGVSTAESGLFLAAQILAGTFGIVALSAHQIANTFMSILFMVPAAISQAAAARVGYGLGAGNMMAARCSGLVAFGLTSAYMAVAASVMWIFPEEIASIFLSATDSTAVAVLPLAATLVMIGAVFQIADGLQFAAIGALRGLNDTTVPFLLGLVGYWAIGLTAGYILAFVFHLGVVGLWWGLVIGLTASAALLVWRFHRRSQALVLASR